MRVSRALANRVFGAGLLCFLAMVLPCTPAVGQDAGAQTGQAAEQDPVQALSNTDRRLFNNYTRVFCRQFFRYGDHDKFVILPNYVRDRQASTGKTYDQIFEEMSYTEKRTSGGISREYTIRPPRDEALAASMIIPSIEVGHYGYLNSAVVREVLGPDEAVIVDVQYIYPEAERIRNEPAEHRIALAKRQKQLIGRTYRLVGFETAGMIPGQRWYGPDNKGIHIAVAASDPTHNFILVSFDKLRPIRTHEFVEALSYVRLTPEGFIATARNNRESKPTVAEGDIQTLIQLYVLYYNRFRVPAAAGSDRLALDTRPQQPPARPTPRPAPSPEPETPAQPDRITLDIPEREEPPAEEEPAAEPDDTPVEEPQPEREEPVQPPAPDEDDDWEPSDAGNGVPTFFGIPIE